MTYREWKIGNLSSFFDALC